MAQLTIRDLDDALKSKPQVRAARHNRSMEEAARNILRQAVEGVTGEQFLRAMEESFGPACGVDLEIPPRTSRRDAADSDEGR